MQVHWGVLGIVLAAACSCGQSKDSEGGPSSGGGAGVSSGGAPGGTGGTVGGAGGDSGAGGAATGGGTAGTDGGSGSGGSEAGVDASLPSCPTFADATVLGTVAQSAINEASGVVESRKTPGVLWVHNDSGDSARFFALTTAGKHLGIYALGGAGAADWEDMAIGPGPKSGESYLYAGDIGDNPSTRPNVKVHRVVEPKVDPTAAPQTVTLSGVETFTLLYPDGPHNAETLLVDPWTGDVFIVVKAGTGVSPVFRAKAPLSASGPITLEPVTTLTFGTAPLNGGTLTTGGDISAQGDAIAIRTYGSAFLWRRAQGASIGDALATEPCPIPLHSEQQGEALGFAANGSGYFTVSEGAAQPVYFFAKN